MPAGPVCVKYSEPVRGQRQLPGPDDQRDVRRGDLRPDIGLVFPGGRNDRNLHRRGRNPFLLVPGNGRRHTAADDYLSRKHHHIEHAGPVFGGGELC